MSDSPSGPTLEDVIATYCDAWSQPDPSRREQMLKDVWTEQGIYTDPTVQISGVKALVNHIGTVLARHPGSRVVMTSLLDAHHGMVRFEWRRILADGRALPVGVDFGELASNGKLRRIVGFFGPLAPG